MANLTTTYMGLPLRTPLVPSAGPLTGKLDTLKRLEDAGASAVVLPSLFEEQIVHDRKALHHHLTYATESFAESITYFPEPTEYRTGPEQYLNLIRKARESLSIPVIASLNGATTGGWTSYAAEMEAAGAQGIELNIYSIPADLDMDAATFEAAYLQILESVLGVVKVPVAVKLSPFFSNMGNMAKKLADAGTSALVLFNRFYRPDISLEDLEVYSHLTLSTAHELRLPLTWIGMLYGRVKTDFGASRGVYHARDALKLLMAGANAVMMTSALIKHGPEHLRAVERDIGEWMDEHEYESVDVLRGSMSQQNCPDPRAFERANYIKMLQSYEAVALA